MEKRPKVAVIILNWNGYADTKECLDSLAPLTYPNYEIIVIDNGSSGNDVQLLKKEFGTRIRMVENRANLGFAGGCNVGMSEALAGGADYVLLLNNDVTVEPDFLGRMVEFAETKLAAAALCPKVYFYDERDVICSAGGRVHAWLGRAQQIGRGERDRGQYDRPATRDYADGACMLIRRKALERVGLLDEEYFAYWEETDWCDRARKVGYKCYYVPEARAWHKTSRSRTPDSLYYYLYRRNAFLFLRKRKTPFHLLSAVLLYAGYFGPKYLITHPGALRRLPAEAKAMLWHLAGRSRPAA